MLKWLGTLIVVLFVLGLLWPLLDRLGGLPGDLHFQHRDRKFYFPVATSIVLSLLITLLLWVLRI